MDCELSDGLRKDRALTVITRRTNQFLLFSERWLGFQPLLSHVPNIQRLHIMWHNAELPQWRPTLARGLLNSVSLQYF